MSAYGPTVKAARYMVRRRARLASDPAFREATLAAQAAHRAWNPARPRCSGCGTTERYHKARGLCCRCYDRAPRLRGQHRWSADELALYASIGEGAPGRGPGARKARAA